MTPIFVKFQAKNKEGGLTSIVMNTSHIICVERSLSQGVVLVPGAAFTCSPQEAIRLSNLLTASDETLESPGGTA